MAASDNVSKNQFHMHLFHGTTADKVESIKERGLGADIPMVYLTHDRELAEHYARNFTNRGKENPVVLTVRANPRNLRTDWNSFDFPQGDKEKYKYDESKLRGDKFDDWKNSLKQSGAAVHFGVIPPEDIIG